MRRALLELTDDDDDDDDDNDNARPCLIVVVVDEATAAAARRRSMRSITAGGFATRSLVARFLLPRSRRSPSVVPPNASNA
jgi:hypothetical protein